MRPGLAATGALAAIGAGALLVAGCGSSEANPPPVEPATSPPLQRKPAGRVLEVGSEAEGIAVDPQSGLAAIAFRDPAQIKLVDVADGKVVKSVPAPDPARHLELVAPGGPVLVPVEFKDRLLRVALPSGATTSVDTGDFPHDAVEAADGRTFVGNEGGDTVSVIDGDALAMTVPAPEQPGGIAASGDLVAVVAVAAREIAFYDTDTVEQVAVADAGAGPSHVAATDEGFFYVADTGGDAILVYEGRPEDGGQPRLIDRANVSDSPYGLAIDQRREELWVTRTGANRVERIDVSDRAPRAAGSFPTVRQPNSVGVDERTGRVVVVGRDAGEVQVFDPRMRGDR